MSTDSKIVYDFEEAFAVSENDHNFQNNVRNLKKHEMKK